MRRKRCGVYVLIDEFFVRISFVWIFLYTMVTLQEHLENKAVMHQMNNQSNVETHIECPTCWKKLRADYSVTLTSNPPQHNAWCKCWRKWYI